MKFCHNWRSLPMWSLRFETSLCTVLWTSLHQWSETGFGVSVSTVPSLLSTPHYLCIYTLTLLPVVCHTVFGTLVFKSSYIICVFASWAPGFLYTYCIFLPLWIRYKTLFYGLCTTASFLPQLWLGPLDQNITESFSLPWRCCNPKL